jgi:two-component system, NtrC family, sensor histidine kinase HydH
LQRSVVGDAEENATQAIRALFRFSVLTVVAAFGLCLLLFTWAVRRDRWREAHARQEEHLAFSGVLANGIVHDFRNPMSSVRLDAQMLERELARPEGARQERLAELSGRISRTIGRMDRVFKEFLYLARPAPETLEPVDLAACVGECLETLAPRLEQAEVRAARLWTSPPPHAVATPVALRRALINIVLNAIQFSPRGGLIELDVRATGGQVTLDVLDRGPGIAPRDRGRVFDMFVTSRPEGTGLGLFLARTAVRRCGGEIVALGREGGGTIMRITLKTAAGGHAAGTKEAGQ